MTGQHFSLVDICAYTIIHAMRHQVDWNDMPALADWYRRQQERPAVTRGMRAFDVAGGE